MPEINIVDGKIHADKIVEGELVKGGVKHLDGWLRGDAGSGYKFEVSAMDNLGAIEEDRLSLKGEIDQEKKTITANLGGLKISKADRAFLHSALQERFELHRPEINISEIKLKLDTKNQSMNVRVVF